MNFPNYDIAREFISRGKEINYSDSFDLAKLSARLLRNKETEKFGRDLIIRTKDAIEANRVDKNTVAMWNELLVAAGLYPYVDAGTLNAGSLLRYECHRSNNLEGVYFHEEQLPISLALSGERPVILSAPTSYGKSLLIEEVVASKLYRNIVIIQPTLALLDETRKKLSKYKENYKILVSTSQDPSSETGNVFLFTGERVAEYDRFPPIDFFVIDEFYKLSMERDDDRAIVLNHALYKLLKHTNRFYMLGPMIKDIPPAIKEKLGVIWERTDFATVAVDENMIGPDGGKKQKKEDKKVQLFKKLSELDEPTLIYVSSPAKCNELALGFIQYLQSEGVKQRRISSEIAQMCDWIRENIHRNWTLIDALQNSVAFHHGALPRHLGSSIVDAFNSGSIKYLFCTATLIEGVNTSAKNVILFDKKKGTKPIDFFDYKNIAGRSGRMRKHYIGNVIRFEKEPPQFDFEVDIPILTQDNAPLEILLAIDSEEIKPALNNKLSAFRQLSSDVQEIVKRHSTINIEGQMQLITELEGNLQYYHGLLSWNGTPPSYEHLAKVVELAWNYLAKDEEKRLRIEGIGNLSARWLSGFAQGYSHYGSIGGLINDTINQKFWIDKIPDLQVRINTAAFSILQIARTFFDYKLPKWLTVVQDLQEFVFTRHNLRPGNYTFIASSMENGFLEPGLSALCEYDIPVTAVRKLRIFLRDYQTPEQNIMYINQLNDQRLRAAGLLEYEIKKIREAF